MNKKIKRIIAITLTISAFSIIEPTNHINLTNTVKADAAINTNLKLKNIYLSKGSINFDSETTSYDLTVARSVEEIIITAKPKDSEAIIKINGSEVDANDNYERTVSLDKGDNAITIDVSNGRSKTKTYTLNIRRGTTSTNDDDDDEKEEICLSDLSLSDGEVKFSKVTKTYDVSVGYYVNEIEVKAKPEDSDYTVKVNGTTVYEDDKYETTIQLNKGKNSIEIYIKDGTKENTYTLNITREDSKAGDNSNINASITNNSGIASNISANTKANQWVQVNNKWQYKDSTGNNLTNMWFFDKGGNKNYYLQGDGTMATGWLMKDNHWYYLDASGAMQVGWKEVNGNWYYLNSSGIMQTGWVKDLDGKYYYLKDDGSMVKNTTINGYKLGLDGAWIRR